MTDKSGAVQVIIVMGVSGAGKTTVGTALAAALDWAFYEGDDFHPPRNVALMEARHALTDADRVPWLAALRELIVDIIRRGDHGVIACSALRHAYRRELAGEEGGTSVRFVHLEVPPEVLRQRLAHRGGHFMPPELLASQLATLEPSTTAVVVDGTKAVPQIVDDIRRALWPASFPQR
jgi:gluconokinase